MFDLSGVLAEIAFRHLWQGAVLIALVTLMLSARRLWSAEYRSWFWTIGLILAAVLPVLTLFNFPSLGLDALFSGSGSAAAGNTAMTIPEYAATEPSLLATLGASLVVQTMLSVAAALWVGVAVWKLCRLAAAARRTSRLAETLRPALLSVDMVPARWPSHIAIAESDAVATPMAIGALRPRVALPSRLIQTLPPHQIRHILAHELAHIRRGDLPLAVLQRVIEAIFWWSPLTWIIGTQLRCEREMACDDRAVVMNGCSRQYASALIDSVTLLVAQRCGQRETVLGMSAFDHSGRAFRSRIKRLIGGGYRSRVRFGGLQAAGVSAASLAVMILFLASPRAVFDLGGSAQTPTREATRQILAVPDAPEVPSAPDLQAIIARALPHAKVVEAEFLGTATINDLIGSIDTDMDVDADFHHHHEDDCDDAKPDTKATITAAIDAARAARDSARLGNIGISVETEQHSRGNTASLKTEVIVTSQENGHTVVRRITRHGEAARIVILNKDGSRMTMDLDGTLEEEHDLALSGITGEIVTLQ